MGKDNEEVVDYIVKMVDTDKDGKISFDEFKNLMVQEGFESQEFWIIKININIMNRSVKKFR